jgi:hypothetical protein
LYPQKRPPELKDKRRKKEEGRRKKEEGRKADVSVINNVLAV